LSFSTVGRPSSRSFRSGARNHLIDKRIPRGDEKRRRMRRQAQESRAAIAQTFLASSEISLLALKKGMLWTFCNNGDAICIVRPAKDGPSVMRLPHMGAAR
jgi:hypothetical protein